MRHAPDNLIKEEPSAGGVGVLRVYGCSYRRGSTAYCEVVLICGCKVVLRLSGDDSRDLEVYKETLPNSIISHPSSIHDSSIHDSSMLVGCCLQMPRYCTCPGTYASPTLLCAGGTQVFPRLLLTLWLLLSRVPTSAPPTPLFSHLFIPPHSPPPSA